MLEINKVEKLGIPIFYLEGTIDFHNAPEIQQSLMKEIEEKELKKLVLNFKKVDYLDSPGIGALLGIVTKTHAQIRVCETDDRVRHVLEMVGLLDLIPMDDYEDESLKILTD